VHKSLEVNEYRVKAKHHPPPRAAHVFAPTLAPSAVFAPPLAPNAAPVANFAPDFPPSAFAVVGARDVAPLPTVVASFPAAPVKRACLC